MNMTISAKTAAIITLVAIIITAVVTRYEFPQIKTQTVQVEKVVTQNQIVTVTKTVKDPNGHEEITSTTTDTSKTTATEAKSKTVNVSADWMVSASVGTQFEGLQPIYGVQVQRRILGPFFLGANAYTNKQIGVSLGFEF